MEAARYVHAHNYYVSADDRGSYTWKFINVLFINFNLVFWHA